jgi:hypothetical protein
MVSGDGLGRGLVGPDIESIWHGLCVTGHQAGARKASVGDVVFDPAQNQIENVRLAGEITRLTLT